MKPSINILTVIADMSVVCIFILITVLLVSPVTANASVVAPLACCSAPTGQVDYQKAQELNAFYNKLIQERLQKLTPYQQFFSEVGVDINASTTIYQFEDFQKNLIKAKENYDAKQKQIIDQRKADDMMKLDQENKIRDLQDRVNELESRVGTTTLIEKKVDTEIKTVTDQMTPINNSVHRTFSKNANLESRSKKKLIEVHKEIVSTSSDGVLMIKQDELPIKRITWWEQIFSWFRK